jgi:hypothetical protein
MFLLRLSDRYTAPVTFGGMTGRGLAVIVIFFFLNHVMTKKVVFLAKVFGCRRDTLNNHIKRHSTGPGHYTVLHFGFGPSRLPSLKN